MKFEIITLFPEYFPAALCQSLLGKASKNRIFEIEIIDLRQFATDKHHTVDDTPFGGGGGMVIKIEPLDRCLESLGYTHGPRKNDDERIILTSAAGSLFSQTTAIEYSLVERLTIICGHYLGVDERLTDLYAVEEVSIGDYVLTGGEPAALVMVDAVARLIPKVLGNFESALNDSHMDQRLGAPQYTRPAEYKGFKAPEELLSGDHAKIDKFRKGEAIRKCASTRPELLTRSELTNDELDVVKKMRNDDDYNR